MAGKRKSGGKKWIPQHIWLALHAPPQPEGAHLWCDPGSHWVESAYLVPAEVHHSGMELRPHFWICATCANARGYLPGLRYALWPDEEKRAAVRYERVVDRLTEWSLKCAVVLEPRGAVARLTRRLAGGPAKNLVRFP